MRPEAFNIESISYNSYAVSGENVLYFVNITNNLNFNVSLSPTVVYSQARHDFSYSYNVALTYSSKSFVVPANSVVVYNFTAAYNDYQSAPYNFSFYGEVTKTGVSSLDQFF